MYTGDWLSAACPQCHSDEAVRRVRADATAFTCHVCGYEWTVKRMPLDAEANDIVTRSRQARTEALVNTAAAEICDGKIARHDNAS